jgi:hypothetical protein
MDLADLLHPDDFRERSKALADDYLAGKYALGKGEASDSASLQLMATLFGCTTDEAIRLLVARRVEVTELLSVIARESYGEPEDDDEEETEGPKAG